MPLSTPTSHKLVQIRVETCHGYSREDGLWDMEGRIVDTKPVRFEKHELGAWMEANKDLHDALIRQTIHLATGSNQRRSGSQILPNTPGGQASRGRISH